MISRESHQMAFTESQAAAVLAQAKVDDAMDKKGTLLRTIRSNNTNKESKWMKGIKSNRRCKVCNEQEHWWYDIPKCRQSMTKRRA